MGKYFNLEKLNIEEIARMARESVDGVSETIVEDFIDSDWPNAEDHQEWLDTASPQDIADWVAFGLRDAMETIE